MKYKSVFVPARRASFEKETLFSGVKTITSDISTDGPDLALRCEAACNALHAEGYEVISINDTIGGNYSIQASAGAGWSLTAGLIITARRMGA